MLASVVLTLYVWRSVGGDVPLQPKRYHVTALFDNASQLTPERRRADLGRERRQGRARSRRTGCAPRPTLALEPRFAPLPRDVRAILRQKTLLGETFVELTPGSARRRGCAEGGEIPPEQIADTQPLDRVLGMLDPPTRERLKRAADEHAARCSTAAAPTSTPRSATSSRRRGSSRR